MASRNPPPSRAPLRPGRALVAGLRLALRDHASDRAAGLAFATLLSLAPLLLVALGAMSAAGFSDLAAEQVRRWLLSQLVPAEMAAAVARAIEVALDGLRAGSSGLGLAGLLLMMWAGGALLRALVRLFAHLWGRAGGRHRLVWTLAFWAVVVLVPCSLAVSLSLTRLAPALELLGSALGASAVLAAYLVLPGRRARLGPALLGTLVAALLWEALKRGFAAYVSHALVLRSVIGGLGIAPVFLLWLQFSWMAFIAGAEVAFAAQCPDEARRRLQRPAPEIDEA